MRSRTLEADYTLHSLRSIDNVHDLIGHDHYTESMILTFGDDHQDFLISCRDGPVHAGVRCSACANSHIRRFPHRGCCKLSMFMDCSATDRISRRCGNEWSESTRSLFALSDAGFRMPEIRSVLLMDIRLQLFFFENIRKSLIKPRLQLESSGILWTGPLISRAHRVPFTHAPCADTGGYHARTTGSRRAVPNAVPLYG